MTKVIAILLSGFLFSQSINISIIDIVQLDELVEHAQFHYEEYGDNLFVFISKHYGELKKEHSKKHQEEKEDHEQLPFNHQSCVHISVVFVMDQKPISLPKVVPVTDTTSNFFYNELYFFIKKSDIFQPPKYV